MATYTIKVKNTSSGKKSYLLFAQIPAVTAASGQVFNNVFAVSPQINNDGKATAKFTIKEHDFAICGTQQLGTDVTVDTFDFQEVTLGQDVIPVTVDSSGGASVSSPETNPDPPCAAGAYGMDVSKYDEKKFTNIFCGFGKPKQGSSSNVVAAACWQADSKTRYDVTPVVTFFVSTGNFTEGAVVNVKAMGPQVKIDFTNEGPLVFAEVTQLSDNTYTTPVFTPNE